MYYLSSGVVCKLEFNTKETIISEEYTIQGSIIIYLHKKPYVNDKLIMQGGSKMKYVMFITNWYVTVNTSYYSKNIEDRCWLDQLEKPYVQISLLHEPS